MGGETSTTNTIENIAETAIKMSAKSISSCTQRASQEQIARISGATIGDGNIREITQSMKMVM